MQSSEDAVAWAVLTRAPALDAATLTGLLRVAGSAARLFHTSHDRLAAAGATAAMLEFLTSKASRPTAAEVRWLAAPQHAIVGCDDPRFPQRLKLFPDCPVALYVDGRADLLNEPQLAVVGARNATPQGCETAFALASELAQRGLGITSGLALGIDSAAHSGALCASGSTLAVLGTGVDIVYPVESRDLAARIPLQGALLSEFPLGLPPRRGNFPRRNRLIAGLGLATLVVEAASRSGSLITARWAADQGSDVFAVPGSIYNPLSRGCHALIKQGAKLVETTDDILNELDFSGFYEATKRTAQGAVGAARPPAGMDKGQKILLDALGFDPADLDTLIGRTGLKAEAVSSMMLILELEGHVQAAPGGRYSRVHRSRGER